MTQITIGTTVIEDAEAFLAAHEKLKNDIKTVREENKGLKAAVESTDEEAVNKWKSRSIKAEAKARLEADGVKDADRILKYLKLDDVDFDENDSLVGFDDKVTEVKNDFPELFDKKRRAGGKADIHTDGVADKPKSVSQIQAEALMAE